MTGSDPRRASERQPSHAQVERDAALWRLSRMRRWVFIGAAALTAGFAALVSAVAPGKTLHSSSSTATPALSPAAGRPTLTASAQFPPLAPASELLHAPDQAPLPAPAQSQQATQPAHVSGSS
jgi:hypothetical protein